MANRKYSIEIDLKNAAAAAGAAKASKDLAGVGTAAEKAAERAASAAKRAADRQIAESKRASDARIKELERVDRAEDRAANKAEKSAEKAANAAAKWAKATSDAQQREIDRASAARDREADRAEKAEGRKTAAAEREANRQAAIEARKYAKNMGAEDVALKVSNARVNAANKAKVDAAMQAAGLQAKGHGIVEKAAAAAGSQILGMAAGYASLSGAVTVLSKIGDEIQAAALSQARWTDDFKRFRDMLREQGALEGKPATTKTAIEEARFQAEVGMDPGEAKAFGTGLLNSGAQFKGKTLTDSEYDEFKKKAAKLTVTKGIESGVMGELAGSTLGLRSDFGGMDPDEVKGAKAHQVALADLNQSLMVLQRGRGDNAQMARQLAMLQAASVSEDEMRGSFRPGPEAAAALSVAAEFNPEEAFTYVQAANRGLREFDNPLLKKAGITKEANLGYFDAAKQLEPVVAAEAKAKGVSTEDVLRENFSDIRTQRGIGVLLNKGVAGGAIKDRLDYGKQFQYFDAAEGEIGAAYDDRNGTAQDRQANAKLRLAQMQRGARDAPLSTLRTAAEADLVKERKLDTVGSNIGQLFEGAAAGPANWLGFTPGARQDRIDQRVLDNLAAKAQAKKMPFDASSFNWGATPEGRNEQLGEMARRVDNWGNNNQPAPVLADPAMMGVLNQINGGIQKLANPNGGPAAVKPAPPPLLRAGPAAGGAGRP